MRPFTTINHTAAYLHTNTFLGFIAGINDETHVHTLLSWLWNNLTIIEFTYHLSHTHTERIAAKVTIQEKLAYFLSLKRTPALDNIFSKDITHQARIKHQAKKQRFFPFNRPLIPQATTSTPTNFPSQKKHLANINIWRIKAKKSPWYPTHETNLTRDTSPFPLQDN